MNLMLLALLAVSVSELGLYIPTLWPLRKQLGIVVLVALALVSGALFAAYPGWWSLAVLFVGLYRLFNLVRLVAGISNTSYLRRSGAISSGCLQLLQAGLLAVWVFNNEVWASRSAALFLLALLQFALAAILAASTRRHLRTTSAPAVVTAYTDKELPSITVCVPARNETAALEACLRTLTNSHYPKLEILVLDDCSQDKTSDVIKSFAHDGVRFIRGKEPPANWLAKNWAYERLFQEANGEILIFSGVDIRFGADGLRAIVATFLQKRKTMMSLLPVNELSQAQSSWRPLLLQPLRYAWELSLPRKVLRRPPVLSSCWIVQRKLISGAGSFAAVRRSISPESYFARRSIRQDGYSFLHSSLDWDVRSFKDWTDQWETAVRTRYPQLHRRPELVCLMTLTELIAIIGTAPLIILSLLGSYWIAAGLAAAALVTGSWAYVQIIRLTYRRTVRYQWLAWLPAVVLNIYVRHISMWVYEFSEVVWKGRNICLPVMHVERELPKP